MQALRIRVRYGLKLPDAIQVATAIKTGSSALVTHDRDFRGDRDRRFWIVINNDGLRGTGMSKHDKRPGLAQTERMAVGEGLMLDEVLPGLPWNADGLLPAIAQQYDSGEVLMMAWMNEAAIRETLETGRVCYWSRSRQDYWRKGESSGQVQMLREMRMDCDGDTLLLKVDQTGAACHTGRRHCFYNRVNGDRVEVAEAPMIDPDILYGTPQDGAQNGE